MKFLKLSAIAILTGLFVLTGCDKDEENTDPIDPPVITAKDVTLVVRPMLGDEAIELDTNYDMDGVEINFSFFKFYISGIELMDDAGTILADNDAKPVLVDTEQTEVTIGSTDEDHLHMLMFDIGLDGVTNHEDPTTAEGVLNDVFMHWGWNPAAGYKFTRFDYTYNGEARESHAATDALFREDVGVSVHDISTSGDQIQIVLNVDFAPLFAAVPLPDDFNHGATGYNISYMDILGGGSPFYVE
jgi:hypothetical protein